MSEIVERSLRFAVLKAGLESKLESTLRNQFCSFCTGIHR